MEDKLISRYDILVNRYKELVSEKLSRKDFIEYNEILFSAHSCAIEGNSFSVDETRTLKEKGLDRKSTRLNSSHTLASRMPSSA